MTNRIKEFKFESVYGLASIIDGYAYDNCVFWNYDEEKFVARATRFSKTTLLHLYISTMSMNHFRREVKKSPDFYEEEEIMEGLMLQFKSYGVSIPRYYQKRNKSVTKWFQKNESKFEELFDKMSEELFYLLFSNRGFLLNFNIVISETIQSLEISKEFLNNNGKIKRQSIPEWVKNAVFHRDKGRCVFCNTDLTKLINTLTVNNYDHIVPLDLFGANDPCNIQLCCERCNKSKSNREPSTTNFYIPWWQ